MMSEDSPKITRRPSESSRRPSSLRLRKPRQLSTICCAIWLVGFFHFTYYEIDNSSSRCTKSTSCLFSFLTSRKWRNKWNILKKAAFGISREIWCFSRETGRLDGKLGDSQENRESWRVRFVQRIDSLQECWLSYCFLAWSVFVLYTIKIAIKPPPVPEVSRVAVVPDVFTIGQYKMQTADCRFGLKCRLGTKCRL